MRRFSPDILIQNVLLNDNAGKVVKHETNPMDLLRLCAGFGRRLDNRRKHCPCGKRNMERHTGRDVDQ